ncbi:MAG: hypothetical protein ACK46X_17705, partial [Candidatus Sericytochromatia bacterium]
SGKVTVTNPVTQPETNRPLEAEFTIRVGEPGGRAIARSVTLPIVPKGAANRELAFEWMKLAVSDRYSLRMAKEMGRFPTVKRLYDDPFFRQDPAVKTFVAALPGARPYRLDAYPQADQAFMDAVRACFYGADPATELEKAQRVAQLAIDATEGQ